MTTTSGARFASHAAWSGPARVGPLRLTSRNAGVTFVVRFLRVVRIRGSFDAIEGELTYDDAHPAQSSLVARVEVASIRTGNRFRDAHLRSRAWFDAARYPLIELRATRFERSGGTLRIGAALSIRDRESPIQIACEAPDGGLEHRLEGRLVVARSAFGIGPATRRVAPWDPRAYLVDDAVSVELRLQLQP